MTRQKSNGQALSTTRANYNPDLQRGLYLADKEERRRTYHYEKVIGTRQSNGTKNLKKLKPMHATIVSEFLQGRSGVEIAEMLDINALTVYKTLKDPLVQHLVGDFLEGVDKELAALSPLALDAIRDGLTADKISTRLSAVDRFGKLSGAYSRDLNAKQATSAEDLIKDALAVAKSAIALRSVDRSKHRLIDLNPEINHGSNPDPDSPSSR